MNNLANLKFRPVNLRLTAQQEVAGSMLSEKKKNNKSVNILFIMTPSMVSGFLCSVVLPLIFVCQLNIIKS